MLENNKNNVNNIAVASLYCFVNIENIEEAQPKLLAFANRKYLKGTIILAKEGFNGSISGDLNNIEQFVEYLTDLTSATNVSYKVNYLSTHPFSKMKIKLKKEIVALKYKDLDVESLKGEYIKPQDWDEFTSSDDVIVIDTRNKYESNIGSFKGSIAPDTETFREFPKWAKDNAELFNNKKIAMFCTGGIRCEKSTALMKELGHEKLYHLEGGILKYLEDTQNKNDNYWGECFVFDDRGAVDSELKPVDGYWVKEGDTAKAVSEKQYMNKINSN